MAAAQPRSSTLPATPSSSQRQRPPGSRTRPSASAKPSSSTTRPHIQKKAALGMPFGESRNGGMPS